eukprot:Sspe_Gene.100598::Locus_75282_Transcript_1_1_Confidence_1.000_Length_2935::g.100598::m.100598
MPSPPGKMCRVGIDVGGTNTDAVCVSVPGGEVVGKAKHTTTPDILTGIEKALEGCRVSGEEIESVTIGTTHFLNAVIERSPLLGVVGVIRLAGRSCDSVPPFTDFPPDLRRRIEGPSITVNGGLEIAGEHLPLDEKAVLEAGQEMVRAEVSGIAVSCPFSVVNPDHELRAASILKRVVGSIPVSLSHQVATSMDLLKRENSAILNAALRPLAWDVIHAMQKAIPHPLQLTQNDGTLLPVSEALAFPVRTFSSGPTNSSRGAGYLLAGRPLPHGAIVMDIGGTTTDVVLLTPSLFPRQQVAESLLGGVRTNFRIPDVHSIGLGGGSVVTDTAVGPVSVGRDITTKALSFGGTVCTATDIAAAAGLVSGLPHKVTIPRETVDKALRTVRDMVQQAVHDVKVSKQDVPLVVVGGGSILVDPTWKFEGVSEVINVPHHDVANAIGAAITKVSAQVDRIVQLDGLSREMALEQAVADATALAKKQGAKEGTIEVTDKSDIPLAYLKGDNLRVTVRVVGDRERVEAVDSDELEKLEPPPKAQPREVAHAASHLPPRISYQTLQPVFENGYWVLQEADIDCIAAGAGILGCGGGGATYTGKLRVKAAMSRGGKVRVVHPHRFTGRAVPGAFFGAPAVLLEKMASGTEVVNAIKAIEPNPENIMLVEVGGTNALEPMVAAAELGVPVVDADGMGRAFPTVPQYMPLCLNPTPSTVVSMANDKELVEIMPEGKGIAELEAFMRSRVVDFGCAAACALAPLSKEDVAKYCVPFTISQAWTLGRAVVCAREEHEDPIAAVCKVQANSRVVYRGRIDDVDRRTSEGFTKGTLSISCAGAEPLEVLFQNENLVARSGGKVVACVPDLIAVLHTDTAAPVHTEEAAYGMDVSVVVIPAPPLLKGSKALEAVGPRHFGYDIDYTPCGEFKEVSVW